MLSSTKPSKKKTNKPIPLLLDIDAAAEFLGIKASYLRHLLNKKISPPPFQPTGKTGKIYFNVNDLELWAQTTKGQ